MAGDRELNETERQTIELPADPEYVGSHSGRSGRECAHRGGQEGLKECESPSTHTVVMKDQNGLHEVAMCDEHGEPEDVTTDEREWSGRVA